MKIRYIKHVPYEGPGAIADWAAAREFEFSGVEIFRGEPLPEHGDTDALVVLGGPMGVGDEAEHPWLIEEKRYIGEWIDNGKPLLGVCLGAQLIASAMGAGVRRNASPEIGWYPVRRLPQLSVTYLDRLLPPSLEVFHWHHDTFEVPHGTIPIAYSELCANQGFVYRDRVIALQFHLEMDESTARDLIANTKQSLNPRPGVQGAGEMLADPQRFSRMYDYLEPLLDAWVDS